MVGNMLIINVVVSKAPYQNINGMEQFSSKERHASTM
jgi:hypothetical protein